MDYLDNFTTDKLIDIVNNYERYRYSVSVKYQALAILESRGIKEADLTKAEKQKTVKKTNQNSLKAKFHSFSWFTILFFAGVIVFQFYVTSYLTLATLSVLFILFLIFLSLAYAKQRRFFIIRGNRPSISRFFLFFLLGIPLYPALYFLLFWQIKKSSKA